MKEVDDVHPQGVCDVQEMAELHLFAGFHALDRGPVEAARVGEALLGHVLVQPPYSNAVADGSTGVEDPLRLFGWHPSNALTTKIISQQQI